MIQLGNLWPPRNGQKRAYTKQPGGRKPPVTWVPWTPRPGRNSSTDPTPQQMPRPDPPTPRLTRRRPCAALQRLMGPMGPMGSWSWSVKGKFGQLQSYVLNITEYLHIKGIQGLEWLERKMNVESWQGSSFKPAMYSRYHRRNTMKFRYLHHRALSPLEALTCIWQLFVIASLSLEALARLKDKVHHAGSSTRVATLTMDNPWITHG